MSQIAIIDSCYSELEKIKAEMIAEKKRNDEPEKTTFSEVVCFLICEYYSAKKLGGEHMLATLSPPVYNDDLTERSISDVDESSHILQDGNPISPVEISPIPVLETTKLYFNILEKDYEKFLDLNMKFYVMHQNDLDDVSIVGNDIIIETRFVAQYRRFMNENNFMEK